MTMAATDKTAKTDKPATETTSSTATAPRASKPPKMLHHAYAMADAPNADLIAEVVTFGTWAGAAEYALPRKWDVVSGLPGVPLTELIKAARP
jgi:hypothetical protein